MEIDYRDIAQAELQRQRAALCIIVDSEGATPRGASSKMLVFEDGKSIGTIGGGNVEWESIEAAKSVIAQRRPRLFSFDMKNDLGMICGGSVKIYIEPIRRPFPLYIFGAGHVGKAIASHAVAFGFDLFLIDKRPEMFADVDSSSIHCLEGDYLQVISDLSFDDESFFIITTPRHEYDETILAEIAGRPHAYIGMMASPIKVTSVREKFLKNGVLTEQQISSIDMPIGVPMTCVTPEEIAISVLARIIDVKNKYLGYDKKR